MSGAGNLLRILAEAEANFIIVGAYASFAHGYRRGNIGLDICYERTPSNCRKLTKALHPLHAHRIDITPELRLPIDEELFAQIVNIPLNTDHGRLDLVGELSGVGGYRELLPNSVPIEVAGTLCRVASLADIIRSKEAANRPKDRLVLPELRALLEAKNRG
jgi:hypothetical protein